MNFKIIIDNVHDIFEMLRIIKMIFNVILLLFYFNSIKLDFYCLMNLHLICYYIMSYNIIQREQKQYSHQLHNTTGYCHSRSFQNDDVEISINPTPIVITLLSLYKWHCVFTANGIAKIYALHL